MYICVYGYVRLSVHADMRAFVRVCEFHACFFHRVVIKLLTLLKRRRVSEPTFDN